MSKEEATQIADQIATLRPRKFYASGDNDMIKCVFCARLYRPGDKLTTCECPICKGDATLAEIASNTLYDHLHDLEDQTIEMLSDELIGSGISLAVRRILRYRRENNTANG